MEILGCIAAALIGISLGLIGAGGGILTVPVMVYLFHIQPVVATSYSLFVVGFTSLLAASGKIKQGNVRLDIALLFGVASIAVVFIIRKWVVPFIPEVLFMVGKVPVTHSTVTMLLFALLMIFAALSMLSCKETNKEHPQVPIKSKGTLLFYGAGVGAVTGLLGAGGGFILIPALVMLLRLDMKEAVGTSLFVIALNSLIGFAIDIGHFTIDWKLLGSVTLLATIGIGIGVFWSKNVSNKKLKLAFGWFVLVMGSGILLRELSQIWI